MVSRLELREVLLCIEVSHTCDSREAALTNAVTFAYSASLRLFVGLSGVEGGNDRDSEEEDMK